VRCRILCVLDFSFSFFSFTWPLIASSSPTQTHCYQQLVPVPVSATWFRLETANCGSWLEHLGRFWLQPPRLVLRCPCGPKRELHKPCTQRTAAILPLKVVHTPLKYILGCGDSHQRRFGRRGRRSGCWSA
jgi:hypothetical protein